MFQACASSLWTEHRESASRHWMVPAHQLMGKVKVMLTLRLRLKVTEKLMQIMKLRTTMMTTILMIRKCMTLPPMTLTMMPYLEKGSGHTLMIQAQRIQWVNPACQNTFQKRLCEWVRWSWCSDHIPRRQNQMLSTPCDSSKLRLMQLVDTK